MMTLKPYALKQSSTIGIVAPSLPILPSDKHNYEQGKSILESFGFNLVEGRTTHLINGWTAGTCHDIAADINAMFSNPDIDALIAHTGGFSAFSVLDLLDYENIRQHPKLFIGLSDITLYHWAMFMKTSLVGFYGNDLTLGFGHYFHQAAQRQQHYLRDLYLQLLTSTDSIGQIKPQSDWECWREGQAKGPLIGGNLKRFLLLAGTHYFPPLSYFDNAVLFWEDIGESIYDYAIYFHKLKHIGIFERISGMIVGQPVWINTYFEEVEHSSLQTVLLDVAYEYSFPILAHVDFGHHISSIPIPLGLQAEMDAKSSYFAITEAAVQ